MELNERELKVKEYMEKAFVPALHMIINKANPNEYRKWGGNCCRQTAILGYPILKEMLPDYQWTAWDGVFKDVVYGQHVDYEHAWLYGRHSTDKGLFVDLSRNHQERLFIPVSANRYPKDNPSYKDTILILKTEINVKENLKVSEYYTDRVGIALYREVRALADTLAIGLGIRFE